MRVLAAVITVFALTFMAMSVASAAPVAGARYLGVTSEVGTIDVSVSADGKDVQSLLITYPTNSVISGCSPGGSFNAATATFTLPITGGSNFDSGSLRTSSEYVYYRGTFGEDGLVSGMYTASPSGLVACTSRDLKWAAVTRPGTAEPARSATFSGTASNNGTVTFSTSSTGTAITQFSLRLAQECASQTVQTATLTDGVAAFLSGSTSDPVARFRIAISGTQASGVYVVDRNDPSCPPITGTFTAKAATAATAVPTASATAASGATAGTGTISAGAIPTAGGFGLVVFGGGTVQQLVTATRCPSASMAIFFAREGAFVIYVPGTAIEAVNQAFLAAFPGGVIPPNTPFVGRCV